MAEFARRREVTRARLIEGAIEEFGERGIDATSVEQLCERSGYSRGAFYSNFTTKDDLCIAILEFIYARSVERVKAALEEGIPSGYAAVILEAVPYVLGQLKMSQNELRTLTEIQLRTTRSPELKARFNELREELMSLLEPAVIALTENANVELRLTPRQILLVADAILIYSMTLSTEADAKLMPLVLSTLVQRLPDEEN